MTMALLNHNGEILTSDDPLISIDNRSFRYGDGLFETMRVVDGNVVMLDRHLDRLVKGMNILKLQVSPDLIEHIWNEEILDLCKDNKCLDSGRIRLTVYRKSGGYYTPSNSNIGYLLEAEGNDTIFSDENAEGLYIGLFDEIRKPINLLSGVKTANCLVYIMAGLAKVEQKLDDMIILNEKGRVTEVISSNFYCIKDGTVKTPALSEGCVAGVTREWLLEKMHSSGLNLKECELTLQEVAEADEVFVSNAIQGIRQVLSFQGTTYSNEVFNTLCKFKPELDQS